MKLYTLRSVKALDKVYRTHVVVFTASITIAVHLLLLARTSQHLEASGSPNGQVLSRHTSSHCIHGGYRFERNSAGCSQIEVARQLPDLDALGSKTRYEMSIVASILNEGPNLIEWIAYHLMLGVEHFYLYDDNSSDNSVEVLQPLIKRGLVTMPEVPKSVIDHGLMMTQNFSLRDIGRFAKDNKYLVSIDVDEFIFVYAPYSRIQDVLARPELQDVGGVKMYRLDHGMNKRKERVSGSELALIEFIKTPWGPHPKKVHQWGKTITRSDAMVEPSAGVFVHEFAKLHKPASNVAGKRNGTFEHDNRHRQVVDGIEEFAQFPMYLIHHGQRSYEDCTERVNRWVGKENMVGGIAWRSRIGMKICDDAMRATEVLDGAGLQLRALVPALCQVMWDVAPEYCTKKSCCASYQG